MADDLNTALRALANRWAMKARDFARAAKEAGATESQAAYDRGFAEAYYRAATELAEMLKGQAGQGTGVPAATKPVSSAPAAGSASQRDAAPASPAVAAPPKPAPKPEPPAPTYTALPLNEAYALLEYGGCQPQTIAQNKDNSFRATFSSWGKMMPHEQVSCVQKSDPRIIILGNGKLETNDYFIDFAFKDG